MKIKTRLTIVGILLAAGPCVLGIWGIGKATMDLAAKAMLQQVENQLTVSAK